MEWRSKEALFASIVLTLFVVFHSTATGQVVLPGSGTRLSDVGDDFEDPNWSFDFQLPKVYNESDNTLARNSPGGVSTNGRWYEGNKRGQPDVIQRIETPPGGLAGSNGALVLRSQITGGPRPTYRQQQDDFIANVVGDAGKIDVSRSPSVVTRVWLPPIEEWERRSGCHFAFRLALETAQPSFRNARFNRLSSEDDISFWPGIMLNREISSSAAGRGTPEDRIYFWIKAGSRGEVVPGPEVTQLGWWTLGMSVSPDGQVHFFAKPGIDDLTMADHVTSSYPFGKRAIKFRTFFFNVCNGDDGKTWSTWFIVDDPTVYVGR